MPNDGNDYIYHEIRRRNKETPHTENNPAQPLGQVGHDKQGQNLSGFLVFPLFFFRLFSFVKTTHSFSLYLKRKPYVPLRFVGIPISRTDN